MSFKVFGNVDKRCLSNLIYLLNRKRRRRKGKERKKKSDRGTKSQKSKL